MPKTIFFAPNDRNISTSLQPPVKHVSFLPEKGPNTLTAVFQSVTQLPDTLSWVLFSAPRSVAADIAGALHPDATETVRNGGAARVEVYQDTWEEVCQWKIPQPAPPTGKTLVLVPVPEGAPLDFWHELAPQMREKGLAPQAGFCSWGIDRASMLWLGLDLSAAQNRPFPLFSDIHYSFDEEPHPASLAYESRAALRRVVLNHLSGQDPHKTQDGPELQVRNGPLLDSIMLAVPPLLARAIANCLLPQSAQIAPKAWDGTSFLALKLPFHTWGELTPLQNGLHTVAEGTATILHHVKQQAELAPVAPTAAPEPITRRIVLLTPAACEKTHKKAPSEAPLTPAGRAALADVINRLGQQEIAPQIILASPAADATLTAKILQNACESPRPLERPPSLLTNHRDLPSVFDALTRPQNTSTATVFVVAAPADLARLTALMGGEPQTFTPNADCRIAELSPGTTWADVSRSLKKRSPTVPIKAYLSLP